MEIRFWGVRGSVAVSGSHVAWIGGNTPCLEVRGEGHRLILDAGTGLRGLGEAMMREARPSRATMLFSHLHWDHVQGFPFFTPAYIPGNELMLIGPGANGEQELRDVLHRQMQPPNFPVALGAMKSTMRFGSALDGRALDIGPFKVTPFELPHPQGCLGYRIESAGRSFVYATDVELSLESLRPEVAKHIEGADVLCMDAMYTPQEYGNKRGWGHSTMMDAAKIARSVGAKKLYLFHHDPAHNDETVQSMAVEARGTFAHTDPAREGMILSLKGGPG